MTSSAQLGAPSIIRRIPGLHWWIAGIAIALYGALLCKFSVNFPIDDDYDAVMAFDIDLGHVHGPVELVQLFLRQDNENRLLFNKMVLLLERQLAGNTDLRRLIVIGNIGVFLLFGLLVRGHRRSHIFPFAVVTTALLLFQPSASESMFWAMDGLLRNYALVFALLSFLLVEKGAVWAAAFFACLNLYQQVTGLVALLVTAGWLLCRVINGNPVNARKQLAAWGVMAVGITGTYFANYVQPAQTPSFMESIANPLRTVEFFLAFAGSGVGYLGVDAAVGAGTGVLCAAAYLTYRRYFLRQPAVYAFLLFLVGSAAMAAIGRSPYGIEHAINSRYALISNCLFACVVVGVASVVDGRRLWRVGVQTGLLVMALAHASAAYASCLPAINERRDSLIEGAALFAQCGNTAKLRYDGDQLRQGKRLQYLQERGYWMLPSEAYEMRRDEPCPPREHIVVEPIPFSVHEYHGEKMGRTGGSVVMEIRDNTLRLEVWAQIPSEDPQVTLYLGIPVLPSQSVLKELEPTEAGGDGRPADANVGLELLTSFPPNTDLQALMSDLCIAYASTSLPLTMCAGNLPICMERLVAQDGEPVGVL